MLSHLRHQFSFSPIDVASTNSIYPTSSPPQKKQKKMTVTQTYYLAHTARGKLSSEASRGDHDLRLLVGHANLLDSLMLELHDAEREQDDWLEHSVNGASKDEPKHIQWQETAVDEPERELEFPDASDTDSDDSSDDDDDDEDFSAEAVEVVAPLRRMKSPPAIVITREVDEDQEDYDSDADDDEENADLALVRIPSRSHTLPELVHESSDSEEDDSPPTTPPTQSAFQFSDSQIQGLSVADYQLSVKLQQEPLPLFDSSQQQALCYTNQISPMVAAVC